jgi:hypothetical protein
MAPRLFITGATSLLFLVRAVDAQIILWCDERFAINAAI